MKSYLQRYSVKGDTVLDPFGGTGVTAIEAFLLGRSAIHNDLNPFANFIAECIADTTLRTTQPLLEAFARLESQCAKKLSQIETDRSAADRLLNQVDLPENIRLPKNSDAEFYYDLFTPTQLAGLAVLKEAIESSTKGIIRKLLLLAWSASVAKLNKTFLSAKGRAASRGGSSIFSIYRYKLAGNAVELPIWETFKGRFENVLTAKDEVLQIRSYYEKTSKGSKSLDSKKGFQVFSKDASALDAWIPEESVDYIFTDPPYGAFISYLDLSVLWNHWLGFPVSENVRQKETIVGGDLKLSEEHYKESLGRAIRCSMRLLKPDRWLSIVFQHWDVSYFSTILASVTEAGGQLRAAITQTGDVIWSMHKKKNSERVLSGEMILTFYKARSVARPKAIRLHGTNGETKLGDVFDECLNGSARSFSSEELFNRLVVELWKKRAINCLGLNRERFAIELKNRGWEYNPKTHRWINSLREKDRNEAMLFDV